MRIARSSMSEQDTECSFCSENFGSTGWWIIDRFELQQTVWIASFLEFRVCCWWCGLRIAALHRSHHAGTGHFNGHKFFGRYSTLLISSRTFDSVLYIQLSLLDFFDYRRPSLFKTGFVAKQIERWSSMHVRKKGYPMIAYRGSFLRTQCIRD